LDHIEMLNDAGKSIFGAIAQTVRQAAAQKKRD